MNGAVNEGAIVELDRGIKLLVSGVHIFHRRCFDSDMGASMAFD